MRRKALLGADGRQRSRSDLRRCARHDTVFLENDAVAQPSGLGVREILRVLLVGVASSDARIGAPVEVVRSRTLSITLTAGCPSFTRTSSTWRCNIPPSRLLRLLPTMVPLDARRSERSRGSCL